MKYFDIFKTVLLFSADEGAGGGDPAPPPAPPSPEKKETAADLRSDIKALSGEITKIESGQKKGKEIAYFEGEEDAGEEGEPRPEPIDMFEDPEEGEDPAPAPEGETGDPSGSEGDPEAPPEGEEPPTFYDPQTHAEGKDVYPNSYSTRQDAEFAIAAKIERYDELVSSIEELGASVGAAIPSDIQQKIDDMRDVTKLGALEDDQVREFVAQLDMGLKAVGNKHSRLDNKVSTERASKKVQQQYESALEKGKKFSQDIGLANRLPSELGPNASFDDVLALADDQIEKTLAPLNNELKTLEDDKEYVKEHGQKAYLAAIREKEAAIREKKAELQEGRQSLIEWNDARVKMETAKAKSHQPTEVEVLRAMDDTFSEWKDDRSEGPFALDIFQAPTTDPVKHFRKYALAPANRQKFDLTTHQGWDEAHKAWRSEMDQRFKAQQETAKKQEKRTSSQPDPIPEPSQSRNAPPKGSPFAEQQRLKAEIAKQAKSLFS